LVDHRRSYDLGARERADAADKTIGVGAAAIDDLADAGPT
jgi:hypothetical protein